MPLSARLAGAFIAQGRVRSFWRILFFFAFMTVAIMIARYLIEPLPLPRDAQTRPVLVGLIGALAAGWLVLHLFDGRRPGALGFAWARVAWREALLGFGIGAGAMAAATGLAFATGRLDYVSDTGSSGALATTLLSDLGFFGVAAAAEEALFRGYPLQALVQGVGAWPAMLLASAGFALGHANNPNIGGLALVNIGLAGVALSIAYLRTRSLWFVTAMHAAWNWVEATLFDLPVSGIEEFDTPRYEPLLQGPDWWTGGSFGPEGGLIGTVAWLVLLVILVRWKSLGESAEMAALRPLVDERIAATWPRPRRRSTEASR